MYVEPRPCEQRRVLEIFVKSLILKDSINGDLNIGLSIHDVLIGLALTFIVAVHEEVNLPRGPAEFRSASRCYSLLNPAEDNQEMVYSFGYPFDAVATSTCDSPGAEEIVSFVPLGVVADTALYALTFSSLRKTLRRR